jgi:hypothetical protein
VSQQTKELTFKKSFVVCVRATIPSLSELGWSDGGRGGGGGGGGAGGGGGIPERAIARELEEGIHELGVMVRHWQPERVEAINDLSLNPKP